MAAHNIWRINTTSTSGGSTVKISEVEFRIVASGADQTSSGEAGTVAAASSTDGSEGAGKDWAYDNAAGTRWGSTTLPAWTEWDFTLFDSAKDVVEVSIQADATDFADAPTDFTIEYSDGGAYTVAETITGEAAWTTGEVRVFTISAASSVSEVVSETCNTSSWNGTSNIGGHRFFRVRSTESYNVDDSVRMASVKMREEVGGSDNHSMHGVPFASTSYLTNQPDYAFISNGWRSHQSYLLPHWWAYDFGAGDERNIKELLFSSTSLSTTSTVKSFYAEWSDDGLNWYGISDVQVPTWTLSEEKTFDLTEASLILEEDIISYDYTYDAKDYSDLVSEIANLTDNPVLQKLYLSSVLDNIDVISTVFQDYIYYLSEDINLSDSIETNASLKRFIDDGIRTSDVIRLSFFLEIFEVVNGIDLLESFSEGYSSADDSIVLGATLFSQLLGNNRLLEVIEASGEVGYPVLAILSEIINVESDLLSSLLSSYLIEDGVEVSSPLAEMILMSMTSSDLINITLGQSTKLIAYNRLEENLRVFLGDIELDGDTYYGWTYNPENKAVTNYDLNFSELTSYKDNHYLANGSGLYLMGGKLDEGSYIESKVTTAGLTFGKRTEKQIPQVFLGVSGSNHIISVSVDERDTVYYELKGRSEDALATKTLKIGKGLIGNTWQFSITDKDQLDFDLDSLEFFPIFLKRKHR